MTSNRARPAQLTDVTMLATLMVEVYAEASLALSHAAALRAFEQLIRLPDRGRVWILECDATPAGFIVMTLAYAMEYGGLRAFVDDFFVMPKFRRRGVGTAALECVKAHCRGTGVRALYVQAGPANDIAQRVYKRAGFVDTGHQLLVQSFAPPIHTV